MIITDVGGQESPTNVMGRLRPRTQTFSYSRKTRNKSGMSTLSNKDQLTGQQRELDKPTQDQFTESWTGSLVIPAYTFVCKEKAFLRALIRNTPVERLRTCDMIRRPEDEVDKDEKKRISSSDDRIESYISSVQKAFTKSMVCVVYYSLQHDLSIHRYDLQEAIDLCDNERVLDVDITGFLENLCCHLETDKSEALQHITGKHNILYITFQKVSLKLFGNISGKDGAVHESFMKKKFNDMILDSFDLVPSHTDLFYFKPSMKTASSTHLNSSGRESGQGHGHKSKKEPFNSMTEDEFIQFKAADLNQGKIIVGSEKTSRSQSFSGPGKLIKISYLNPN